MLVYAFRFTVTRAFQRLEETTKALSALEILQAVACAVLPLDAEGRTEGQLWVNFWGHAVTNHAMAKEHNRATEDMIDMLSKVILDGQQGGDFRKDMDAVEEAHAFVAFIDGIALHATLDPGRYPSKRQIGLVDRYLSTLRAN